MSSLAVIQSQVNRRRREDATDGGDHREDDRSPVGQRTRRGFAADLQADEKKEKRQEPLGAPLGHGEGETARGGPAETSRA